MIRNRSIRLAAGRALAIALGWTPVLAMAQATPPASVPPSTPRSTPPSDAERSAETSALVEGLLDLIAPGEDVAPRGAAPSVGPLGDASGGAAPGDAPDDGPADDATRGFGAGNSLEAIQRQMVLAANLLTGATDAKESRQLQADITRRLDALIAELERGRDDSDRSRRDAQQREETAAQPTAESDPRGSAEEDPSPSDASQGDAGQSEASGGEARSDLADGQGGDIPRNARNASRTGSAEVEWADPRSLQQSAWGHLPERVRKQMQSRMVEQFLPSYRERIEAYFQSLLETE